MSTSNRISRTRVSSLSSTRFLRWLPTRQAATRSIGRFHATRFEFQPILTLFTSTRTSVVSSCHCTLPHACITGRRSFRLHKYRIDASPPAAKRLSPRSSCSKIGNVRSSSRTRFVSLGSRIMIDKIYRVLTYSRDVSFEGSILKIETNGKVDVQKLDLLIFFND